MTNINRLKLKTTSVQTLPAAIGSTLLPALDQVANDFKQSLKVVGILVSMITPTETANSKYIVGVGVGTTPGINTNGELFRWDMYFDNVIGISNAVDLFIGNMHDTIFEFKPWDTELVQTKNTGAVGATKGELYLNMSIQNLVAVASVVRPKVFITFYYKL